MTPEDGIKYTLKKLCRDTCRSWLYDKIDGELDCPMCGISQQKRIEDGMCHGLHNSHVGLGFAKMLDNVLSTFLMSHDYTQNPYNESVGIVKSKFIELHTNALNSKKCAIQVSCSKCNPKIEKCTVAEIEIWKLRGKDAWKEAKYGTLIPRRDDGRPSEKSARPGDIRYFMGVCGNGADVSDSDSPNDNGGSVSDSDDIYDDNGTMSDDTIGDASDTTLSDSPTDSDTSIVLRGTTLSGQKRPMQTLSVFSCESSAGNKRRRIPTLLTPDEIEMFEEWCSTWRIVKTDPRIYIKSMELRVKDAKSYSNYCKARDQDPINMTRFVSAMKAKGHVTENVQKRGGGVAFYDIAFVDKDCLVDKDCPRPRRICRNSEDFSENGQNLTKRLSLDKIHVATAKKHFSTWKKKHGLVHDSTKEKVGSKTRPKYYEKCAKVWNSYQKFSAEIFKKHRFNKNTFQTVMEERGFCRVRSRQGSPCGYAGSDWYYTNMKVNGSPL